MTANFKKAFRIAILIRVAVYILVISAITYPKSLNEWFLIVWYCIVGEFLLLASPPFIEMLFNTKKFKKEELLEIRAKIDKEISES